MRINRTTSFNADTTTPSGEAWPVHAPTVSIFDFHTPKGYIDSAMTFSVAVEVLDIRMRAHPRSEPVHFYETLHPQRPKRRSPRR